MSLDEFKRIYWWEWAHRFLARSVGVLFAVPFIFFLVTGRVEKRLRWPLAGLFFLGGLQGAVGWWMVASGLVERVDVSQYRLATHLTLACIIFAAIMWVQRGLAPHSHRREPPHGLRFFAGILVLMLFLAGGTARATDGPVKQSETDEIVCSLPGALSMVTYRGEKGEVWSCGGGNWCAHLPDRPGVCGLDPKSKSNLDKFLGSWEYAWGNCEKRVWFQHKHKSAFRIGENEVVYFNELEPLGSGRIIKVTRTDKGIDVETILRCWDMKSEK